MAHLIDKDALVAEIERRISLFKKEKKTEKWSAEASQVSVVSLGARIAMLEEILSFLDTLEVKEVDISSVSENLAEAYEYLDYTSIGNLAHNKPMVSARLKKAIQSLFNARLFELTHDTKYRMENLGLKAQKG